MVPLPKFLFKQGTNIHVRPSKMVFFSISLLLWHLSKGLRDRNPTNMKIGTQENFRKDTKMPIITKLMVVHAVVKRPKAWNMFNTFSLFPSKNPKNL